MRKIDGLISRSVAFDVLNATLYSRQPFDEVFNQHPLLKKMEQRDRGFAYYIIITTLRHLGQINNIIEQCLKKRLPPKANRAKIIISIGVCQFLFLKTPPHAAVSTSVALADQQNQGAYKKLINAILRRVTNEGNQLLTHHDVARLNTPKWLWDSWVKAYGEKITRLIVQSHMEIPKTDLFVKNNVEEWAEKLGAKLLFTGGVRLLSASDIPNLEGYEDGAWWVQDAGASLPAQLFGKNLKGKKIADICAAPGGKTAQLLAAGATVVALDRSKKRLQTLLTNLERLSFTIETFCVDAGTWQAKELFDGVLVDAPCSATGTIRRHPDVQYLKDEKDVAHAHQAQLRLLNAAAKMIKPDGQVIFATCSLQPEEGPEVVDKFLANHPDWQRQIINSHEIGGRPELISSAGDLRTLPHYSADIESANDIGGMDGFFAARLIKK